MLLETERKLLTDALRVSIYGTESALVCLLAPHYARSADDGRALLREAVRGAADLWYANGQPRASRDLSPPRLTRALTALCDVPNDTATTYPRAATEVKCAVKQPVDPSLPGPLCQ